MEGSCADKRLEFNRNFHFAFRLPTNIPPFASAADSFSHSFQGERPERAQWGLWGENKTNIIPISRQFLGHFFVTPLRGSDWFRLAAAPIRLAATKGLHSDKTHKKRTAGVKPSLIVPAHLSGLKRRPTSPGLPPEPVFPRPVKPALILLDLCGC